MSTTSRTYRLADELLERLEKYRARLEREVPRGMRVSEAAAVGLLLDAALQRTERRTKRKRATKRRKR